MRHIRRSAGARIRGALPSRRRPERRRLPDSGHTSATPRLPGETRFIGSSPPSRPEIHHPVDVAELTGDGAPAWAEEIELPQRT